MALSFTEKRRMQKVISTNEAALAKPGVSFTDKRRMQKEIQDAMAKLGEQVAVPVDAVKPPTTISAVNDIVKGKPHSSQKLADLIAGKYNKETPEVFLKIVKDVIAEINDVQPVIEPAVSYLTANQSLISEAAELVFAEVFGKRFEQIRIFEAAKESVK